jgi:hypothetical protein
MRAGEMNVPTVVSILSKRLDSLCPYLPLYCPQKAGMDQYKETSALLAACWHNTEELDSAMITAADKALFVLSKARERAVARFKAEDVCFYVDEVKCKEIEAARLQ